MSLEPLPSDLPAFLDDYLPKNKSNGMPFITLTYAQSLDSRISQGHGIRTAISHSETKTMTHYLRHNHDGILVGTGTVLADDPGLNCKWTPENSHHTIPESPRPIIIDMKQEWTFVGSKMHQLFKMGQGKAPLIIVHGQPSRPEPDVTYIVMDTLEIDWSRLASKLRDDYGIYSVMVEGGAQVINQLLLRPDLVDSLIVTIGSTYLGSQGVEVSPKRPLTLEDVTWWKGTADSVMCARLAKE